MFSQLGNSPYIFMLFLKFLIFLLEFQAVDAIENIQCSKEASFRVTPADFNLTSFDDHQVVVNRLPEIPSVDCLPNELTNFSASFAFVINRCSPTQSSIYNSGLLKNGIDHKGMPWTVPNEAVISGVHYNIDVFKIENNSNVQVASWNGTGGGKLEIFAKDIYIHGTLTATGKGYRGGMQSNVKGESGKQGESIERVTLLRSTSVNLGGGGGGAKYGASRLPGGGGSYGTNGTRCKWRFDSALSESGMLNCGFPGLIYGDQELSTLHLGSGGGSGGKNDGSNPSPSGARGGNGGGAIRLFSSNNLEILGSVLVDGENGDGDKSESCAACPRACSSQGSTHGCHGTSTTACYDASGAGGGGSGGSLYLRGTNVDIGVNKISVNGGRGGYGAYKACGGDGGNGRIRIDYATLKGSYPDGTFLKRIHTFTGDFEQYTYTYSVWAFNSSKTLGQPISRTKFNFITVTCVLKLTAFVKAQQTPLLRIFSVPGPTGAYNKEGKYKINFGLFPSSSFSEPFMGAFPEVKVPNVIAGQITSETNNTNIILQASKCWATPQETNYEDFPVNLPSNVYPIIDESCLAQNSFDFKNEVKVIRNYDTKVQFQFQSFLWPNVSFMKQKIYVYCLVTICDLDVQFGCKNLDCPNSQQKQRQRREVEPGHVISIGPIKIEESFEDLCLKNNGGCDEICSVINNEITCSCYEGKTYDSISQSCKDIHTYVGDTHLILFCVFGTMLGLISMFVAWKLFKKDVPEK